MRLAEFLQQVYAVVAIEVRKLRRDPTEVLSRSIQPVLWLVVFGQVFGRMRAFPSAGMSYIEFMAPGILAQSILFSAIFYGIAIIWERDLGVLHKMLVSPAYRSALVLGKALAAGARGLIQAVIIYLIALVLGIHLRFAPTSVGAVVLLVVLGSALFSTLSLAIACIVKTRERFMGIGQLLTMPLFFASNAIYPLAIMPAWLRVIARGNPLTYLVDGLRGQMLVAGASAVGLGVDLGVQVAVLALLVLGAAKLYPSVIR